MAKTEIQTENLSVKEIPNLNAEEKEKQGEIYRICYLADGENIIILDDKDAESLQRHTSGKTDKNGKLHYYFSVKCQDPSGNVFRLYLSSLDAVAFTAPYGMVKDGKHYEGKVKAVRLTDAQVGTANVAYRACTTQAEMLKEMLNHTKNGKCRLSVKVIGIGAENPNSDKTQVAVERDWSKDSKEYTFKGVKHLYSISFVDWLCDSRKLGGGNITLFALYYFLMREPIVG